MSAGTVRLPAAQLLSVLKNGSRIVGVSITPTTHEVVAIGPPYTQCFALSTGRMLSPTRLKQLVVDQQNAGAMVLGGSALFKADGTTHFGVRKLISEVLGLNYDSGDWLPKKIVPDTQQAPSRQVLMLLCRNNEDDAATMLTEYLQRYTASLSQRAAWEPQAYSGRREILSR